MYISDVLGERHLDLKDGDNILISSQTGSGKTQYVYQKLLPDAVREGKEVVYYCNRITLYDQNNNDIKDNLQRAGITDSDFLQKCLNSIHIRTYQEAETHRELLYQREREECISADGYTYSKTFDKFIFTVNDVKYYIFDEAHYFISDTLFNARTNLWEEIISSKHKGIFVFLTATPDPLLCLLNHEKLKMDDLKLELYNAYSTNIVVNPTYHAATRETEFISTKNEYVLQLKNVYERIFDKFKCELNTAKEQNKDCSILPFDYNYLIPYYFIDIWAIISKIKNSKHQEKWLIFVDDKILGKQIYSELCKAIGEKNISGKVTNIAYINANIRHTNKNNSEEAHTQVYSNSKFNHKVLIATSVLDCGVNILDYNLKNMVVITSDKTSFIQMIGRVRRLKNQKINLYIHKFSYRSIMSKLYHIKDDMKEYCKIYALHEHDSELIFDSKVTAGFYEKTTPERTFYEAKEIVSSFNNPKSKSKLKKFKAIQKSEKENMYLIGVSGNTLAWLNLLYSFYIYQDAINAYEETQDTDFFLKEQLKWINQNYDDTHWVDDMEASRELNEYLYLLSYGGTKLSPSEQKEFSYKCVELFLKYHNPPENIKGNISRYLKYDTYPQKAALNKAFVFTSINYHIESEYDRKNKVNYWIIKVGISKIR